jgi:hypothetical protein
MQTRSATGPATASVPGRLIFVTYASGLFEPNLERNGRLIERFMQPDLMLLLRRADLEADPIYPPNKAIYDAPKGAGYWAWKPWAILKALEQARDGDVVVYQDCGTGLRYKNLIKLRALPRLARAKGFIAGVETDRYGPNRKWTHRACIEAIGSYTSQYLEAPQVEASVSLWTNTPQSMAFVRAWLGFCLDPRVVGDPQDGSQEDPAFIEHRYDQSILTCLAVRESAPVLRPARELHAYGKSLMVMELEARGMALPFRLFGRLREHFQPNPWR